jgi:hypothetical protein
MARAYAQIVTAIWRNDDFTALPHDEQWLYLLLTTQPDISAAGVLTLAVTRWAKRSPTMKPDLVNELIDRLAARAFLIVDRDTDELLIRSFIRWDKGYSNPKRQPAIRDAIKAVESPAIAAALAIEASRIGLRMPIDRLSVDEVSTNVPTMTEQDADSPFPQMNSLSDAYPMPIDSVSTSERRVPQPTTRNPHPPNHNPKDQNLPPAADASVAPALPGMDIEPADKPINAGSILAEWIDRCVVPPPERTRGQLARNIKNLIEKDGYDPRLVRAAVAEWHRRGIGSPAALPNVLHEVANHAGRGPRPGAVGAALPDGRHLNRKANTHFDHLAAYGEPDA